MGDLKTNQDENLQIEEQDKIIQDSTAILNIQLSAEERKSIIDSWDLFNEDLSNISQINQKQIGIICINQDRQFSSAEKFNQKIMIVDRKTLKALSNAKIIAYYDKFDEEKYEFTSDSEGICELNLPIYYDKNVFSLRITVDGYEELKTDSINAAKIKIERIPPIITQKALIFTDRNRYKPGDIIKLLIWIVKENDETISNATLQDIQIKLLNSQSELLFFRRAFTDEYGYFTWDIPLEMELKEDKNYKITLDVIDSERNVIMESFERKIEVKYYRRPEIKTEINTTLFSWYGCEKLVFDVNCNYFYGDSVKTGIVDVEIEDILHNKEKFQFEIKNGLSKITLEGYNAENLPFHSGLGTIHLQVKDSVGRKGDIKKIPVTIFTSPISLDINHKNLELTENEFNSGKFEFKLIPKLIFECFDYLYNPAECEIEIQIIDMHNSDSILKYEGNTNLKTGFFEIPMEFTDRDYKISRWDRKLKIKVKNEKYSDSFELITVLNFKIKRNFARKDDSKNKTKPETDEKTNHYLKIHPKFPDKQNNQGQPIHLELNGSFRTDDVIVCILFKNRIYTQKFIRAGRNGMENVEIDLNPDFTGKFQIFAAYIAAWDGGHVETTTHMFDINPQKQILNAVLEHNRTYRPGDKFEFHLKVFDSDKSAIKDGTISGVLVDKASLEMSEFKYPDLPEIFDFGSIKPEPKLITPLVFPRRDMLKAIYELIKSSMKTEYYELAWKFISISFVKLETESDKQDVLKEIIKNFKNQVKNKINFIVSAIKQKSLFQGVELAESYHEVIYLLVEAIFPPENYAFPLELMGLLDEWGKIEDPGMQNEIMQILSSSIIDNLHRILLIEERIPKSWEQYFKKYGISNESLYYYLFLTDRTKFLQLDEQTISFPREKPIIDILIDNFKKNFKTLLQILVENVPEKQNKVEQIKGLFEEFDNVLIIRNSYVSTVIQNRFIILEQGSRFIKYSDSNWEQDNVEFVDAIVGYPRYTSIMTDVNHYTREYHGGGPSESITIDEKKPDRKKMLDSKKETIRENFAETSWWLPVEHFEDGSYSSNFRLPDSITTHNLYLVTTDRKARIGANLSEIIVKQDFFISVQFPDKIVHGDILNISVFVTNLTPDDAKYTLGWEVSDQLHIIEPAGKLTEYTSGANDTNGIEFSFEAKHPGIAELKIYADSEKFKDTVIHKIEILPAGNPVVEYKSAKLTNENATSRNFNFSIPIHDDDAVKAFLTIIAHPRSDIVESAQDVLNYGFFCNEQVVSMLSMCISIYDSLYSIDQLTIELEDKFNAIMAKCVQKLISNRNSLKLWGWWHSESITDPFITTYIHDSLIKMSEHNLALLNPLIKSTHNNIYNMIDDGNFNYEYIYGDNWKDNQNLKQTQKLPVLILELKILNSILLGKLADLPVDYKNTEKTGKLQHSILVKLENLNFNSDTDAYQLYLIIQFYYLQDQLEKSVAKKAIEQLLESSKNGEKFGTTGIFWETELLQFGREYLTAIIGELLIDIGGFDRKVQLIEIFLSFQKSNWNLRNTTLANAAYYRFFNKLETENASTEFSLELAEKDKDGNNISKEKWEIYPDDYLEHSFRLYRIPLFRYPYDAPFLESNPQKLEYSLSSSLMKQNDEQEKNNLNVKVIIEIERWKSQPKSIQIQDSINQDAGNKIRIKRHVIEDTHAVKIIKNPDSSETYSVKNGSKIGIKLMTEIQTEDKLDHVVIEEPIPAGFTYNSQEIKDLVSTHHNIDEITLDPSKITFILSNVKDFEFNYNFIAIRTGSYTQKSTMAYCMYNKEFEGSGNLTYFTITE